MKATRTQLKDQPAQVFEDALAEPVEITYRGRVTHILLSPKHPAWITWLEKHKEDSSNKEEST